MESNFGSAPVIILLVFGILVLLWVAWVSAIDLSISRMSKAYVQGLVDGDLKNASRLLRVVEKRRTVSIALHSGLVAGQAVSVISICVGLVDVLAGISWNWWEILLAAIVLVGILELLIVAVLPYKIAGSNPRAVALTGSGMAEAIYRIVRVLNPLLEKLGADYQGPASADNAALPRSAIAEDLREMADEMLEDDVEQLEEEDKEILRSVFELGQTRVGELMVPRTEMVVTPEDQTAAKALRLFNLSGFSRIPVIGKDVDDVVGVLYFKDVVATLTDNPEARDLPVSELCRKAAFIPETKLADDELREMQQSNTHLALVVDEYGGIAGLITIEDILEELVGELHDEHDRNTVEPAEIEPGVWRVPASYPIDDLGDLFDLRISDEDVYSVGGLLGKAIGKVPLPGAKADALGLHLLAEEAVGRRRQVGTIVASLVEPAEADDADSGDGEAAATGGGS